jgi:seryl-tRNA synthetase
MRYEAIEHLLLALIREVDFSAAVNGLEWQANLTKLKLLRLEQQKVEKAADERIFKIVDAIAEMPDSTALREKLRALELEKANALRSIREAEKEISDLSMASTEDRDALLLRLNDTDMDDEERVRQRKKVNAEIRRLVRSIRLKPTTTPPYETSEGQTSVEAVEVSIGYRNGNWQHFDSIEGADMHGIYDPRFKTLKTRTAIQSME